MLARKQWKWGVVFSGENLSLKEIVQIPPILLSPFFGVDAEETKANHYAMIEAFSR